MPSFQALRITPWGFCVSGDSNTKVRDIQVKLMHYRM
nr:MAG TPA_asm: protein of unknown function (DUF2172) [Caudoviricetes sp.]DAT90166.1 MAG TPA: protein of unknown function (DUF2172) [Caudoviricetes sp.]